MQEKSGADKAQQPIQPSPAPRVPRIRWPFTQQQPAQDLAGQAETLASAPDVAIPAYLAPLPCLCRRSDPYGPRPASCLVNCRAGVL